MTTKSLDLFLNGTQVDIQKAPIFFSGEAYPTGPNRFTILLAETCSEKDDLITLAHELVHVFYKVIPPYPEHYIMQKENKKVEDLIENEARKFIRISENRKYLRELLSRFYSEE